MYIKSFILALLMALPLFGDAIFDNTDIPVSSFEETLAAGADAPNNWWSGGLIY